MSDMSKQARADMRAKASRMVGGDPRKKVDSSSWTPSEPLNAGRKTGARPIRPMIYKAGGAVQGDRGPARADRKPRADGGKVDGGLAKKVANAYVNRDVVQANKDEFGSYHKGGFKRGGKADGGDVGKKAAYPSAGLLPSLPGGVTSKFSPMAGTRKAGGKVKKRASGGKAESYWSYKPSEETPSLEHALSKGAIHPDTTEKEWGQMSPGMRREVVRSAKPKTKAAGGRTGKWYGGAMGNGGGWGGGGRWGGQGGQGMPANGFVGAPPAMASPGTPALPNGAMPMAPPPAMAAPALRNGAMPMLPQAAPMPQPPSNGQGFAKGGRAKGKTNINIVIGHPGGQQAPPMLPPGPIRPPPMPMPVPAPGGAPPGIPVPSMGGGAPPGGPPAGGAGPLPMPLPMGRKAGGRIAGNPPKTASSPKDMRAGGYGGLGRLEKASMARKDRLSGRNSGKDI
jgi:hypothetical protein